MFIISRSIIILRLERRLLKGAELNDLLRNWVPPRTLVEVVFQIIQLCQVLLFHAFDTFVGGEFVINHVLVPCACEFFELGALESFEMN